MISSTVHFSFQDENHRYHIDWQKEIPHATIYCDGEAVAVLTDLDIYQTQEQLLEVIKKWIQK